LRNHHEELQHLPYLRRRAEDVLRERIARSPTRGTSLPTEEGSGELHEVSVSQIELELQNEELRRALEQVEATRLRYTELYDQAPVGYVTVSEHGLILHANLTAAGMLGETRGSLINQPVSQFILMEDRDRHYRHCKLLFETGERKAWELRMVRKNKTLFWVHMQAGISQDAGGAPMCRLVMSDITERKDMEERLREAYRFNEQIIKNTQEGVIVYGSDLRYLIWNTFMEELSGVPASEALGKHPLELFPFLKDVGVIEQLEKVLAGQLVGPRDFPFDVPSTGRSGWASDINSPLRDQKGEIIGVIGMVRDITNRKEAEEALRISNEKFTRIYNLSPDAIDLTHLETGVQVEANQSYLRMFGYTREELIGHSTLPGDLGIWVNQEDRDRHIARMKEHVEDLEFETLLRRKDGSIFTGLLSSSLQEINGEQYNQTICRDITERKKAEIDLLESEQKFRAIFGSLTEGVALHELVRDENGRVQDYRILDVNPAFHLNTGLDPAFARGRLATELYGIPVPPYLEEYSKVALDGVPYSFETFFLPLGKHFRISVISPRHGQFATVFEDITERKQAEISLQETNAYLENLINCANAPIIVWDPEFKITRFNHAFESLTGRTESKVLGKSLEILFPSEFAASSMDLIQRTQTGERWETVEIKILNLDGTVKTVLWNSATLFAPDGKTPLATIAQGQDITKRKAAEEALRESEEEYRRLVEDMQVGVLLQGPQSEILMCNHKALELLGISEDQLLGKTSFDPEWNVIHEDGSPFPGPTHPVPQAIASKRSVRNTIMGVYHPLGKYRNWLSVDAEPQLNGDGTVRQVVCTFIDITERKEAEAELLASEKKFSKTFSSAPLLVSLTDLADGRLIEVNDQYCEVLGYTRGELLGNTTLSLRILTPEDRGKMLDAIETASGTPKNIEFSIHTKTGKTIPILFSGSMIEIGGREILISMVLDITELKQVEAEKNELNAQLQQAQKMESLGTLVAGVAHNLNNVLAIVMGMASLREEAASEPADQEAYQSIGKVCMRGRDVVKSLIHFAQPTLSYQAPLELNSLIQEVCALLESTTRNRIKIVEALYEEPLWSHGNAGDISHILVNLGINSLDAMPDGGVLTFRTSLRDGNQVEVSVEDNGTGMAPEVLTHVMEPFYTTKEVGKGTGLGLSMTYGVVKAHNGDIDISSQMGQGTSVKLRFPRIPAPVQVESVTQPVPSLAIQNIFLVDDEEDVRFLMTRMLKKAGVRRVKTFDGGEELLDNLPSEELPDLIILDQNMPGMNGTQTMERIRCLHPEMPILISSGQPDIESWDCFKAPKVGVISKPFTMGEIQSKLALFVNESSQGQ